jgi:hypothetical protein
MAGALDHVFGSRGCPKMLVIPRSAGALLISLIPGALFFPTGISTSDGENSVVIKL